MIVTDTPKPKVDRPFMCQVLSSMMESMGVLYKYVPESAKGHLLMAGVNIKAAIRAMAANN